MNWSGVALLAVGTVTGKALERPEAPPGRSAQAAAGGAPAGRGAAALDRLFADTRAQLHSYFTRRLGNPELAAEYVQDAFLRFMKMSYGADGQDARAILFGIARNLLIDHLRRRRRHRECGFEEVDGADPQLLDGVASLDAGPERSLGARQELALALAAIHELPPRCREVFVMHRLHGLAHKDIARELGITRSMVEKHIMEATSRLMRAVR